MTSFSQLVEKLKKLSSAKKPIWISMQKQICGFFVPSLSSCTWLRPQKKDLYRRKGKGRHLFLGDRIDSIPCRASYFVPWRCWRKGWIHPFSSNNPGACHPILQIFLVHNTVCSAARKWINSVPPKAVTTFATASIFILLLFSARTMIKAYGGALLVP